MISKLEAYVNGGGFYLDSALSTISISTVTLDFAKANNGGFIYIKLAASVDIKSSSLSNLYSNQNGSCLASYSPTTFNISGNIFNCQQNPSTSFSSIFNSIST